MRNFRKLFICGLIVFISVAGTTISLAQEPTSVSKGGPYLTMKNAGGEILFQLKYVNKYVNMTPLVDGYALAYDFKKADVINSKGEVVSTIKGLKVFEAENLGEGVFAIKNGSFNWAHYTSDGKQITEYEYDAAGLVRNGFIRLLSEKGKAFGLIDKTGKVVVPFEYESLSAGFDANGLIIVGRKRPNNFMEYALMDKELKMKTPYDYFFLRTLANGQYLYSRSLAEPWYRYWFGELGTKGLMDRDLRVLTEEIIPAEALIRLDTAGRGTISWNKKDYTFLSTGKFTPDNGEFEYHVANSRLPAGVANWRTQDSMGWDVSKKLYRIALQKGYTDAAKKMDSLLSDQFYINVHPALKYKQQSAGFDKVEKLAKGGDPESMIQMAGAYLLGTGRPVDTLQAISWFDQAVKRAA